MLCDESFKTLNIVFFFLENIQINGALSTLVVRSLSALWNNLDGHILQEKTCNSMVDLKIIIIPVLLNQIKQMNPF